MDGEFLRLLRESTRIPALPQVAARFLKITSSDDYDSDLAAKCLESDPGLASAVLRLVNSPFFGLARKVSELSRALNLLGPRQVRQLVVGGSLVRATRSAGEGFDHMRFWRCSIASAIASLDMAKRYFPVLQSDAFLAGLLADIGTWALHKLYPSKYLELLRRSEPNSGEPIYELERRALCIDHAQIGGVLLDNWKLPPAIVNAAKYHHEPQQAQELPSDQRQLVYLVHVADAVTCWFSRLPDRVPPEQACARARRWLNLTDEQLMPILEQLESAVDQTASAFGLANVAHKVAT